MATDQLAYIRGIHGVTVNTIEIHEKDFKDKVCGFTYFNFEILNLFLICQFFFKGETDRCT